ncbi:MAG: hypothetical protein ACRD4S_13200 [Candidatus Acidiferrales bacterium]
MAGEKPECFKNYWTDQSSLSRTELHRGHRNSKLAAFAHGSQRSVGRRLGPHRVNTAAVAWSFEYDAGFPKSLAALEVPVAGMPTCAAARLRDSTVAGGTKSGYKVALLNTGGKSVTVGSCTGSTVYQVTGVPQKIGQTGQRGFFSDQSDVVRFTTSGATPTISSPALQ